MVSNPLVLDDLCYIWISGAHTHMFYQYNACIKRRTGPAKASWDISKTWLVLTACLSATSPTKLSPNFVKNPGLLLGSSKAFPVKISACIARNCWWRSEYWWGLIGWTRLSLRGLACPSIGNDGNIIEGKEKQALVGDFYIQGNNFKKSLKTTTCHHFQPPLVHCNEFVVNHKISKKSKKEVSRKPVQCTPFISLWPFLWGEKTLFEWRPLKQQASKS